MNTSTETDLLAELINQKHDVLVQMRDLSRQQSELIGRGEISQLLAVLSAKQTLLIQLQKLEKQLTPFRDQDPESRQWRSVQDRQRCRQVAERCETLLKEIMLVERQSETDLTYRRDQAAERLQGVHGAAQARRAYAGATSPVRSRLDVSE